MGDNVYMDYFPKDLTKDEINNIKNDTNKYLEHMKNQYNKLLENKYYQKFLDSNVEITGTWDDHDYYKNNTGSEIDDYIKNQSKKMFFDFINYNKY